jgi:protein ImuB
LGPEVLQLIELARGRETDTPLPVPKTARLLEAIDLEFPVDRLEPLAFIVRGLLSRLLARLEARHLACDDLNLILQLQDGARNSRQIRAAAPTRDLRILAQLVCHALESHPPQTAVESVALETEGCRVQNDQLDLFRPAGPAPAVLGHILAELEVLCGKGRIGSPQVVDSHHPDALRIAPFQPSTVSTGLARPSQPIATLAIRALRPPLHASVRVSRGIPEHVRSAIANGRVIQIAGPWRTTGNWWSHEERFAYDSFDVQTHDGTVARLRFDHIHKTWHIDAVYD